MFPFWFCQHRWVEDIKIAEQALRIWPHVNKYVKTVKNKRITPASASFITIASACDNILIEAKLEFLLKFEIEALMTPFLAFSLNDLLLAIMGRFLKKEILEKADTLVCWFTPPLPRDGGVAQTAIQIHAINLIMLG